MHCSLFFPLGRLSFSAVFQGHPLNMAVILVPFIFGLHPIWALGETVVHGSLLFLHVCKEMH